MVVCSAGLRDEMGASIQGVERDPKAVIAAISKGVPVIQADLDQGLDEIPDHAFDYAVLKPDAAAGHPT